MIRLAFVLRTNEEIKDCLLYNKHLAPNVLDDEEVNPVFSFPLRQTLPDFSQPEERMSSFQCHGGHTGCKRWRKAVATSPYQNISNIVFLEDFVRPKPQVAFEFQGKNQVNYVFTEGDACGVNSDISYMSFFPSFPTYTSRHVRCWGSEWRAYTFIPSVQCTMIVNGHLASCMMKQIGSPSCQRFRRHLFKNLNRMKKFSYHLIFRYPEQAPQKYESELNVTYLIDIVTVWPKQRIDYAWGWYINYLLVRHMLLEEAMAWLSTLGGAHSSLGEYFTYHAEMAGKISGKQMKLAVTLGDPITVARCHMFWAYSLLQRGFTCKARAIVRRVHQFAISHSVLDMKLVNMCLAAWTRLQHLHRLKLREKRKNPQVCCGDRKVTQVSSSTQDGDSGGDNMIMTKQSGLQNGSGMASVKACSA